MKKTILYTLMIAVVLPLAAQRKFVFPAEVKPLVGAQWAQDSPFNKLCPWEMRDSSVHHAYAGCGPLVMSQVMYRYRYPLASRTLGATYDWNLMFDRYTTAVPTAAEDAVARLIVDCGTSANTVYGQSASSTKLNDLITGLKKDFGYSRYMNIADRKYFPGEAGARAWKTLIYSELKAGRPIILRAERNSHFAHVFIIDGCRDSTVHVNFGWGGKRNGYYDPDSLYGFRSNHRMIVGVAPDRRFYPSFRRITLNNPGELARNISDADWLQTRYLKVSGPLNHADIALLRAMAGGPGRRKGNLAVIDMSQAVMLALPDSAFQGCDNLTYVTLPQAIPDISAWCFANCPKLNRVDFDRSVVSEIKKRAFYACFCLTDVKMSPALRTVGEHAFNSCNSLSTVVLPPAVRTIGYGAFSYCRHLYRLVVPRAASGIGPDVTRGTMVRSVTRL